MPHAPPSPAVSITETGTPAAVVMEPDEEDMKGYDEFIVNYKNGLAVERAAVDSLKM